MIDLETLKSLLMYDKATGVFTWKKQARMCNGVRVGRAGCKIKSGHIHIKVADGRYYAHRLAWFYVTGEWPSDRIDHINGVADDNRFENLRVVSHSVNLQNLRKARQDNKLRLLGVTKRGGRYVATISIKGRNKRVGYFSSPEEAYQAYVTAKRLHHEGCTI